MTVSELIRDLQTMPPHLPVHILPSSCMVSSEQGEFNVYFEEENAVPSDDVRYGGAYVLITGRQ